jgi:hypothetical protein
MALVGAVLLGANISDKDWLGAIYPAVLFAASVAFTARCATAFSIRIDSEQVVLRQFHRTRRVPLADIESARVVPISVVLIPRQALELSLADGSRLLFEDLNQMRSHSGPATAAAEDLNARLASSRPSR